jgi:hypothetical protein
VVLVVLLTPLVALAILLPVGLLSMAALMILGIVHDVANGVVRSPSESAKESVLTRFAADNGLLYRRRSHLPSYPGCIFTDTNTRFPFVYDHFSTLSGRYLDFGNYHSVSGPGDGPGSLTVPNPLRHSWGFIALQMDQQLPNILLISKHRVGGETVLPIKPDPSQILILEGNFDRSFTLYCPREFERDALYILTPDLMALLMDEAAPFDVEIIDRWMFLYVTRPFNSLDPAVYQRIFRIVETIGSKIVGQTSHYSNATLGPVPTQPFAAIPTRGRHEEPTPSLAWRFTHNTAVFGRESAGGTRLRVKPRVVKLIVIAGVWFLAMIGLAIWVTTGHAN